ncbi:MAG: cysteine-rich small domain-containing protein [Clostridia bacterium]
MKKNSSQFFCNRDCEYFPCHKTSREGEFNCLFCFCPLYRLDCGGNYTLIDGKIKDCSACLLPHYNYDYIIAKLVEENKLELK